MKLSIKYTVVSLQEEQVITEAWLGKDTFYYEPNPCVETKSKFMLTKTFRREFEAEQDALEFISNQKEAGHDPEHGWEIIKNYY